MFWHYVFSNNSALIEKLLEKEDVTLSELMEEEELLQECQAQNKKLVDFLLQDHILQELVLLVVTEPSSDRPYQVRFKHASIAAELLSAEVPAIVDKLAASESLLETLCNFLSNEKPLNPLLASFFSKVLGMLLHRRSEQNWYQYQVTCFQFLDFLKNHPDFIPRVAHHVGTSAIMNLLHKILCGVEEEEVRCRIHAWVRDTPLISLLIEKLSPENEWCEQANVEQLMCDILDSGGGASLGLMGSLGGHNGSSMGNGGAAAGVGGDNRDNQMMSNSLLPLILNDRVVQQLLGILLHANSTPSSITHVTNVLMKMLSIHSCVLCVAVRPSAEQEVATAAYVAAASMQHLRSEESSESGKGSSEGSDETLPSPGAPEFCVARTVATILPQLHQMLTAPCTETVETSYGEVVERVGNTRLRLIALITALIETRHYKIHHTLAQLNTIPFIIELFFKFPQNNFLHTLVERCVTGLLVKAAPCRTPPDAVLQETRRLARSRFPVTGGSDAAGDAAPAGGSESNADADLPCAAASAAALPPDCGDKSIPAGDVPGGKDSSGDVSEDPEKMEVSSADCDSNAAVPRDANIPSNNMDATSSEVPLPSGTIQVPPTPLPPLQIPSCLGEQNTNIVPSDNKEDAKLPMISSDALNVQNSTNLSNAGDSVAPDEDSHPLLCQLFRDGRLISRILSTYQFGSQSEPPPPRGSLCGYRGHVRNIANTVADLVSGGENAALLNALIQSLDNNIQEDWAEFQKSVLAEANAANSVNPLPTDNMLQISEDDMQTAKDMINAMTYSLSFDENGFETPNTSTGAASSCTVSGATAGHSSPTGDFDGANSDAGSADLFEKLCRKNLFSDSATDDQFWDDKEQTISFAPNAHTVNDAEVHSSDEEDENEKDDMNSGRLDTSMEVDDLRDDWESVFDRRSSDPPAPVVAASAGVFPRTSTTTVPVPMPAPVPSSSPSCSPSSASTPPADFNPWSTGTTSPVAGPIPAVNPWSAGSPQTSDTEATQIPPWANFSASAFDSSAPTDPFKGTNPFETFQSADSTGNSAAPSEDLTSFNAQFASFESTESATGGGNGALVPEDVASEAPSSAVDGTQDSSASATLTQHEQKDQELQSNFHFLAGIGVLKSGAVPNSEESDVEKHELAEPKPIASLLKDLATQETVTAEVEEQISEACEDANVADRKSVEDTSEKMEIDTETQEKNDVETLATKVEEVDLPVGDGSKVPSGNSGP
ncbi:flocculation protein FLO11 isoform X4 [Hyalella azteca]|uniref:Flocculation protein FLO11 isoform X4 n=1 Tax=Hyalella azteca TaxID=294128 RepID=A0A8B7NJ12_HYAAZ|nr:flocculation protein FLO11 isoform X4 [Hyalella azteca]